MAASPWLLRWIFPYAISYVLHVDAFCLTGVPIHHAAPIKARSIGQRQIV